jgi:hypothetical protein
MAETARQSINARTESHSDVANTAPSKAYQASLTERQFADQLIKRLRQNAGSVRVGSLREEWVAVEGGLVHEISAEVEALE